MGDVLDKKDLRRKNIDLLRNCLKRVRQATKPQLAELTGLSVVTVNSLLQEILLRGEAIVSEIATSSGGRPAQMYRFYAEHRLALAVYMHEKAGRDRMFISVENLLGQTIDLAELTPERIDLELFRKVLSPYFERYPQIAVLIIGLPGVEVQQRLAVIDYPELKNTLFCTRLSEAFGCPVILENDINAAVAGYAASLLEKGKKETIVGIYFPWQYPPGAGIFLQGQLYKGRDGMAGEIGVKFASSQHSYGRSGVADKADEQDLQNAVEATVLFALTWNPHRVVIYNERLLPDQAEEIKRLCQKEISEEFLPEIIVKEQLYDDYRQGIRCLAEDWLDHAE